ncbi:YcxB family protein [Hungatella sp. L12]|uniref:YcxB family protein n=1 Tax=Hungatella hominis TaxID=2763050 RepID=A0ABR7H3W7_9FIRM|nr:YcxB family protein [Hungatella hominis]MBC5707862.1 YcxB family protein [Hungatella hominis]
MRELEVQLSKKDILRMMSDMRLKKDGMKESKIQAVMLIIAGISLIYTVGVVAIGGHDPSILWWITDLCAGIGLWLGFAVIITVLIKTVQYFRIIKGPLMHRQLVRFREHRIEMCTEEGVSCYPYASILYAEKTRHQILVYMKRIGTIKTLLTLPDSAFTGEAEMDCCLAFLQEKQQQEAFMDPLDQQAEIICPEEQVYSFAFIQEEAEWLDVLTAGKYYMMRTRYALKIPESMTMILSLLLLTGVGIFSFKRDRDPVPAAVYGIFIILFIGMAYWRFCSRKWIYRGVKRALKRRKTVPDRTGRQVISFDRSGISLCTDTEQWNLAYPTIYKVVESKKEVFIFTKGPYFLNIPVWAFQTEREKLEVLNYLRARGICVLQKNI